ncbi:MAG: hypothetical protein WD558_04005, partial [Pseudomonadales bacterium]
MHYQFRAFLKDPDAARPDNPIHSTAGGRVHGFRGALVGGIHVYGWTTGAFTQLHGDDWIDSGWVSITFKRPTYDGDLMTVNITGEDFTVTNSISEVCLAGKAGPGKAPFLQDLTATSWQAGKPTALDAPPLTLDNAPRGKDLVPMTVPFSYPDHAAFIDETLQDNNPLFHGEDARCHPAWIAGRLIYLLHHSFTYGPAIHTSSQIQHLAPAYVGQAFTVTGHCADTFERNGHHYIVNDGSVWAEDKTEVARLRHT